MPIYEFQCKQCGHRFERMQKFSDPHPTDCPECGAKDSVVQLLSAPAVQFKGSGWYVTDYARKSSAPASKSGDGDKKSDKPASSDKPAPSDKPASTASPKKES